MIKPSIVNVIDDKADVIGLARFDTKFSAKKILKI